MGNPINPQGGTNYIVSGILAVIAAGITSAVITTLSVSTLQMTEQAAPSAASGKAVVYADSATHNLDVAQNNGSFASVTLGPAAGQVTIAGPTAARTITVPDAACTVARTDAANTFTGASNTTSWNETTPVITGGCTASGSGSNNFSGSTGAFQTSSGANTLNGAVTESDATTPSIATASGKTNTGYVQVNGKTSGAVKLTTADATAQTLTISAAAQTTGAATVTIPDCAGTSYTFVRSPSTGPVTFAGPTAARIITVPDAAATMARTDAGQTFTGVQAFTSPTISTTCSLIGDTINAKLQHLAEDTTTAAGYTLVLADDCEVVTVNTAGANTLSIPTNASVAFPVGTQITVIQKGAGQWTIQAANSGTTTVVSNGGTAAAPKLRAQYSACTLWKDATDHWYVFGDIQ